MPLGLRQVQGCYEQGDDFFALYEGDPRVFDEFGEAILDCVYPWYEVSPFTPTREAVANVFSTSGTASMWLLDSQEHPCAVITMRAFGDMTGPSSGRVLSVLQSVVRPDCRRRGLSRFLRESAIEWIQPALCFAETRIPWVYQAWKTCQSVEGVYPSSDGRAEPPSVRRLAAFLKKYFYLNAEFDPDSLIITTSTQSPNVDVSEVLCEDPAVNALFKRLTSEQTQVLIAETVYSVNESTPPVNV